ncbi:hypothetical protein BKN38_09900, partial [Helicobacter sp. CLO-3]|uniref:TonB-dependent receptor domain-containing protein n=3 Tax=unclassified Helicobacter TaxID=2593540 RepID=UPI0008D8F6E4
SQHPDTFGNIFGGNAYVTTPLIKNLLSLNLRGGYRYGDQNSFFKPESLRDQIYAGNNRNPISPHTNPFVGWSATGFTNWNAGGRINYTPGSHNSIYLDSEVYFARTGSLNTSGNSLTVIRDFYKINNVLNHEADYDWGKLTTYLQYSHTMWAPHAGWTQPAAGESTTGNNATGTVMIPIGASKGAYADWSQMRLNQDIVFQTNYNKNFDFSSFGNLILNLGVYNLWERLNTRNNGYDKALNQTAIFGEGEYIINDYVSTTLGVRVNFSDFYGVVANPRFYVNVNPTQWLTFKAGVASGMLAPNLTYLYDGFTESTSNGVTTLTYGNPNLKVEQSWNYEFSTILDFKPAMLIATGYYTDFNNQIETVNDASIAAGCTLETCRTFRNLSKSLMAGAEVALKVKPIYGISLDANYGFTYTEVLSAVAGSEYLIGGPVNSIPRHSFTITPRYAYKKFDMYVRWQGKFQTPTPTPTGTSAGNTDSVRGVVGKYYKDYQLVDVALNYRFNQDRMTATFAINNLFDVDFYDPIIYTGSRGQAVANNYQRILPSRSFWLSLRADF